MNFGDFASEYERVLLIKKSEYEWTEKFVKEWIKKAVYMKENNIELFQKRPQPQKTSVPKR